jgi:hypothetical protein
MTRHLGALILLTSALLTSVATSQDVPVPSPFPLAVYTKDYPGKWVDVPAPAVPPTLANRQNGFSAGQRVPGCYEVAVSYVDEEGKIGPRSPSTKFKANLRDWLIVADFPVPEGCRASALFYTYRKIGERAWKPLGAEPNAVVRGVSPSLFVPTAGHTQAGYGGVLLVAPYAWPGLEDTAAFPQSTSIETPTKAPVIRCLEVPNVRIEVAYSWVTNKGETALSDVLGIDAFRHPLDPVYQDREDFNAMIQCFRACQPPNGALGYHLYLRKAGGPWHRQPRLDSDTNFLYPVDFTRFDVLRFVESGVSPSTPNPQSYLCPLQRCIEETARDIVVTEDQETRSPIICRWYSGAPPVIPATFGRSIASPTQGTWKLINGSGLPIVLWCEFNQRTRLVGCEFDGRGAECGLAFADYFGGCAFHFRSERLFLHGSKFGIRQLWQGLSPDTHSASEPVFRDTQIGAEFPIVCEGNQSANWQFRTLTAVGDPSRPIITQGNHGRLIVAERLTADRGRCLVALTSGGCDFSADEVWIDQGLPCLVVTAGNCNGSVTIRGNKWNQWIPWFHLAEHMNCGEGLDIRVSGVKTQGPAGSTKVLGAKVKTTIVDSGPLFNLSQ